MSRFDTTFASRAMLAVNRAFGVTVMLSRGALVSEAITARREDSTQQTMGDAFEVVLETTIRDYWIPVDSVIFDGDLSQPLRGDLIIDNGEEFEVLPSSDGRSVAEKINGDADWLVHTKRRSQPKCPD